MVGWRRMAVVGACALMLVCAPGSAGARAILGGWVELSESALPNTLNRMAVFTHEEFVYVLGGSDGFPYGDRAETYRAGIREDGTLRPWEPLASLPEPRTSGAAAVVGDYVFFAGGGFSGRLMPSVFRSRLMHDGTLDGWVEVMDSPLPEAMTGHDLVAVDDFLFLVGGFATPEGAPAYMVDSVYRARVDLVNGNLVGGWEQLDPSHDLPQGVYTHATIAAEDSVYVIGGFAQGASPGEQRAVYRAPIVRGPGGTTLDPWLMDAALPVQLYALDGAFAEGTVFVTGGSTGEWVQGAQDKVYRAVVDPDTGSLAPWQELGDAVLPQGLMSHSLVSTGDYLLNLGGTTSSADITDKVYAAKLIPEDVSGPSTIVAVHGTSGDNGWFVSPVTITLSAVDEPGGSGVAYTEYSTDGGATWTTYTEPFTIAEKGVTAILARSADNAGNLEDQPVGEEVKVVLDCQVLFHEDFSSDLSQWTLWGSPLSYIDTGIGHLAPSLQTNGDASYASGITSLQGLYLGPGTIISHHGELDRIDWGNSFALIAYRDWSIRENDTSNSYIWFGCGGSYQGSFTCQLHVWNGTTYEQKLDIPVITPGSFHQFKAEVLDDMRVAFYIDEMSNPIWTSSSSLDVSHGSGPVVIAGRRGWVDNVTVISCDITPPSTTIDVDGTLGDNGWFVSPVTVTLSAADEPGGSGVAYTEYSLDEGGTWVTYTEPFTGADEGTTTVLARSVDNAGNVEDPPVSEELQIDFTPPIIVGSRTPGANTYGWNNQDVTVHFDCSDSVSGIASCTADTVVTSEGEGRFVVGIATDEAGNSASTTVIGINIDKMPPTAAATAAPEPNAYGWNNTDVVVSFSGLDDLSGIDYCSEPTILSSDGANQSASGTCTDRAGNMSATTTASGINIDKTSPEIAVTRTPAANPNGWNNGEVTVQFDCEDPLSGVAFCPPDVALSAEGAGQSASGTVMDLAGNTACATVSNINIDLTDPTIMGHRFPGANSHGWNNEDVTVWFECNDTLAGVAFCTSDTVLSNEGEDQSVTGSTTDLAGNATATSVSDINIDKTAPTVTIAELSPNPASVSESADLVADLTDERSGIQAGEWCAESESLACTWEAMTLTGEAGDLDRRASANISGLPAGVYSIKVKTQDLADNSSDVVQAFLVVYDPSAGFATGGGWIIPGTEPGDFLPGITGEDKANFGFVVKYKKGATTPEGQLEFHYRVGDFNLHSTEMHWMVINDNWAKFQGYATIKLHPDELFHFRVDARDASQGDRFILKVWTGDQDPDLDDPVYRAAGDLMGGNIIIHSK